MYILRYKSFNKMLSTVWKKSTCRLYFSKRHKGIKLGNFNRQKTYFRTKGVSTKSENPITNVHCNAVGACSSNSLATRRGTRNLMYILLLFFSLFSTFTLLLLFTLTSNYSSSSIVAVLIAKAGHVWVSWPEEFLLYILSLTLQQVCYC